MTDLAFSIPLDEAPKRRPGRIVAFRAAHGGAASALSAEELERRLLEIGFVEGARFEVLHQGLLGRDPLVVRLDDTRVALRRREARAILVCMDDA